MLHEHAVWFKDCTRDDSMVGAYFNDEEQVVVEAHLPRQRYHIIRSARRTHLVRKTCADAATIRRSDT